MRAAWGKFRELLPILSCKSLSFCRRGKVYRCCVRGAMLYASECWAPRKVDLVRLGRNERAMLRWMCSIKPDDSISLKGLCTKLGIVSLEAALRQSRLRWFGHVERANSSISSIRFHEVMGRRRRGRPRKAWAEVVKEDLKVTGLAPEMAADRDAWRCGTKLCAVILAHKWTNDIYE